MKKALNFIRALWFWYVVRAWWSVFPPKSYPATTAKEEGLTLDDD